MAKFTHISDFRLPELNTMPPLSEMIRYYPSLSNYCKRLQTMVNKASKGVFWEDELQEDYEKKIFTSKRSGNQKGDAIIDKSYYQ